ncbi:MAG: hypothetical protein LN569_05875 [Rickettsia endosymbiont of Labidopullus appendiculatus]|nr:hypothetical protein [Rickettsia endosymbiont of Labidopullus appendiculatus]
MSIEKERYLNIIYKSPVIFRIKEVALPAFRFFEIEATKKHPRIQIEVDDKTIIKDMIDCCGEALYSLFQDEKKEKHNIRGWSTGYILGFLSSSLWTHWNAEYLYPETEEYKNLMFLRSIYLYSKMDYQYNYQLTFKIQKIYDYFMSHKSDFNSIANTGDNLIS